MTDYTDSDKVAAYLQRSAFDGSSTPTSTSVEEWIVWAEDEINRVTKTSWKSVSVTNEYHPLIPVPNRPMRWWVRRVILDHRPIVTFSSPTDKLEVWNGSSWEDYAADKTEGRGDDFWIDYTNGEIYFKRGLVYRNYYRNGARVSYRYGHSSVEKWVERLCTMMAAREVMKFNSKRLLVQGGDGNPQKPAMESMIRTLTEDIDKIMNDKRLINRDARPWFISG